MQVRQLRGRRVARAEPDLGVVCVCQRPAFRESLGNPVASYSAIAYPVDLVPRRKKRRSRRSVETQPVASKESSRSDESAAQQLTIYEELSKLDVNC
ncbi:hypothetical protein F511_32040 [Dorcoceras hygrometricum]|uniref:Uncharacterized protein n=1 Tax=Dorcoceras hygrometricum TaxID=472368 RepID=A0A2Z7CV90_9LAMI|nr:hypothetical protein F511_32040 [Dorcoceras hygrometricum]